VLFAQALRNSSALRRAVELDLIRKCRAYLRSGSHDADNCNECDHDGDASNDLNQDFGVLASQHVKHPRDGVRGDHDAECRDH
jgi:hypothetical protein